MFKFTLIDILFFFMLGNIYCLENDWTFKVEPGARMCFTESAKVGQMMEIQYQVIDGRHGELDISFDMFDPNGTTLITDYKRQKNAIIRDILLTEHKDDYEEVKITVNEDGTVQEETLEWLSYYENGTAYHVEIRQVANTMTVVLRHVVRARHLLDMYAALRSKDTHLAFKDTFIIDVWSGFQICFMLLVGLIQVYMIKSLFNRPSYVHPYQ